jgi:hypothetical protein
VRTPAMRHARAVFLEDFLRRLPSPSARLAGLPSAQIVVPTARCAVSGPGGRAFRSFLADVRRSDGARGCLTPMGRHKNYAWTAQQWRIPLSGFGYGEPDCDFKSVAF